MPSRDCDVDPRAPVPDVAHFLTNHVATLASMDFFTVPTLTGRVLFVFVLLSHQRRRIVHVNIAEHPTAEWDSATDDSTPFRTTRRLAGCCGIGTLLIRRFQRRVAGMGVGEECHESVQPMAKSVHGEADRFNYTAIHGIIHVLLSRGPHTSRLEKDAPTSRRIHSPTEGHVVAFPEVGGLHHRYECRAA